MSQTTPVLGMPYIQPSQAQKHVTHNEALRKLDALVQLVVASSSLTEPPALPEEGSRFIVATGATLDWAGHDHEIAVRDEGGWSFYPPQAGWVAQDLGTGTPLSYDGGQWSVVTTDFQNIAGLGVATMSDGTNKLAVSAEATLLTHDGAGHQLKVNKATASDTASLLFQTGWSGRAEMGTTGNDDFAIKVSADGSAWENALTIGASTGEINTGHNMHVTGEISAESFLVTSNLLESISTDLDNRHPTASAVRQFFSFNGVHRCAWVANNTAQKFNMATYDSSGTYKGVPLTIEFAGTEIMSNALYIDKNRNVGIGRVPQVRLDVDGIMRLAPTAKASLPAASVAGAGAMAFVSDAAGGAQPAYSNGTDWLKISDGLAV